MYLYEYLKSLVTKRDKRQGEKIELPREKIDDRQANTIPLPIFSPWRLSRFMTKLFIYRTIMNDVREGQYARGFTFIFESPL